MLKDLIVQKVYATNVISDVPSEPIGGNFLENKTLGGIFVWVTNLIIMVGLGLVLVFLALGFISFITSQGDKVKTDQAQKWVTYAVLGGVGLFCVYLIKTVIVSLVGANDPLI